ncbi:MAG: DUF883 family protein [Limisphaerales bacterium]
MSKKTEEVRDEVNALAEDAKALLSATAEVAEEKVVEARERLAAGLQRGKNACSRMRDEAMREVQVTDQVVHDHPYQAIGIAAGVGLLLGYLLARERSDNGN